MSISTGIPQCSALSLINFLFFVSILVPMLETRTTTAVRFLDDTNILTWSNSTEQNCRKLEEKHQIYEQWARMHGARFVPEKYQLMHFSRARKRHNLKGTIEIRGHTTVPQPSLRVLRIYFDPKLGWRTHIKSLQLKAEMQVRVSAG